MTTATAVPDVPFSRPRHEGTGCLKLLRRLHALRRPRHYLEIGTAAGKTLALAHCASIAIDSRLRLARDIRVDKPACHLFEMTSDAFFAVHNPTALSGRAIDLAFIDGMHHFEFALRDFMNMRTALPVGLAGRDARLRAGSMHTWRAAIRATARAPPSGLAIAEQDASDGSLQP
jgi:hypothetical protein